MAEKKLTVNEQWEQMQIKTFTNWCNMHLSKQGKSITSVTTDFKDGIRLIQLLEIIGETSLGKYNTVPKLRLQQIENASRALRFIAERGVSLASIGPEDIVDGNVKLTLGMIWTVILRFAISDLSEEGLSAKQGLLLWCKKKTQGYKDVDVKDFQDSFKDGMAFCALIHKHRPDLINYDELSKENQRENLDLAFEVAEKHLGIPKLLDTDDMVNLPRPDERSVMTYCAALYKVFSQYDKIEMAGHRVGKFINFMKATQDMINDYEKRARALREAVDKKTAEFEGMEMPGEYLAVREKIAAFKEYRRSDKSSWVGEQSDLASLLSSIQIKLKSVGRPAYVPPAGLSTEELDEAVDVLTAAERKYRSGLNAQMRAILDGLRRQFAEPANAFFETLMAFKKILASALEGTLEEQKAELEGKRAELAGHEAELEVVLAAEQRCDEANIEENEYSDHSHEDLKATYDQLLRSFDKKIAFLSAQAAEAAGGVSADKMLEFQQSFEHFDTDGNKQLDRLEFFACLASLGLTNVDFTGQDPAAEKIFQEVSEGAGSVSFEQYVKYMSSLIEETYDSEQLKESFRAISGGKDFITEEDMVRAQLTPEQIAHIKETLPVSPLSESGYDYSKL